MTQADRNDPAAAPQTSGLVFRWALAYDMLLRIIWGRAERAYRDRVIQLAALQAGDAVLDVGCGTGSQAIVAKRRVGASGMIVGIDASPEMITRAKAKAAKAGMAIEFRLAVAEALPFADATFDAVLTTTVLHCLPDGARRAGLSEMIRVLRPGGRLLLVDYGGPRQERRSLLAHLHHHRRFDLANVLPALRDLGVSDAQTAALNFGDLQYVLATGPEEPRSDDPIDRNDLPIGATGRKVA